MKKNSPKTMSSQHCKILGIVAFLLAVGLESVKCNFEEKNVVKLEDNEHFYLTNDWATSNNPNLHEQNIFEFRATKNTEFLVLKAYNITDFTHNPTIFVASSLAMLEQLFKHISTNPIPSNITYTNCTLSYSQQCTISDITSKVQEGDVFYLIFVGVGVNHKSHAQILYDNLHISSKEERVYQIDTNPHFQVAYINPATTKRFKLDLDEKKIAQTDTNARIEVFFIEPQGCLLGDNHSQANSDSALLKANKVVLVGNNTAITQSQILFQSSLFENRQFVIEYSLSKVSPTPLGSNRTLEVEVEYSNSNNNIIGIAYRYTSFSYVNMTETLTQPFITSFQQKSENPKLYEILVHYQHPFFEYLASLNKTHPDINHFNPPKDHKYIIFFTFEMIGESNQNKISNMDEKIYYSKESLSASLPDASFSGQTTFIIDTNKIVKQEEQNFDFNGIYLLLTLNTDLVDLGSYPNVINIKSNLLTLKEDYVETVSSDNNNNGNGNNTNNNNNNGNQNGDNTNTDNTNTNNNNNSNNNNNNDNTGEEKNTNNNGGNSTNNNNNNNGNNNNNNTNNNKNNNGKGNDSVLIIIVVVGVGFIIISTLVYVKCFQNRNALLDEPEELEEIGEDGEKQHENGDDIEKAHSSGDNSRNTIKKPQSTASSTKTNGNHIQLAQDDDKSGLYEMEHNHSSERKSNPHNGDLSANNLNNDKNELISKKPPQRKKNRKSHLRIEIEESDNAKEQQQYLKQQQLKLLQQKALQQKKQQKEYNPKN